MPTKRNCVVCNKSGVIMLCDRCQQTYCDKHIAEHRQKSPNQLNDILQEHDLIQQELRQSSNKHVLFKSIDHWEKESIGKIQTTAETIREELRQMIVDSKERLSNVCRELVENLHSDHEMNKFCQNDLFRTMQQLKQLKTKIISPLSVQLLEDKQSSIRLITLKGTDFLSEDLEKAKIYSITKRHQTSDNQERFSKMFGDSATITDGGLLIKHINSNSLPTYILGEQLYSKGRQTVRFRIEQSQMPYNIFFGCISSQINLEKIHYKSLSVIGWFRNNEVYHHGICDTNVKMHRYDSSKLETRDVVSLTLDCNEQLIEFYPERTKIIHELPIDINKMPFPWQILVILCSENDSVKILYNA